nr:MULTISPECIES: hypothetical protein [unclassified Pseudomonas]
MNIEDGDSFSMYEGHNGVAADDHSCLGPQLLSADTLIESDICNFEDEGLGGLKKIMLYSQSR